MSGHGDRFDVVVVGAGIAGSALACVLASSGVSVLVLERQTEYHDHVRGEYMQPWGAAEMLRMGLDGVLTDAGGGWLRLMIPYSEDVDHSAAEAAAVPLGSLRPDAPGGFTVGHPQASDALSHEAERRGARVLRGVGAVAVTAGVSPSVRYEHEGVAAEVSCRLIIGADGRQSGVRKTLGVELHSIERDVVLGGLLVHTDEWPSDTAIIGVEDEQHFLAFPRPGGFVRLYSCRYPSELTSGPDRARRLRDGYALRSVPHSERLADAEIVGPCAYVRGSDSWTDTPAVQGAVLVGDSAGWNDPILGCGLSIAMRDARSVGDIMLGSDDWSPAAFAPYAEERAERMRRLRACAHLSTEVRCSFTPEGRARRAVFGERVANDALVRGLRTSAIVGPEIPPPESFTDEVMERALAPA